MAGLGLGKDQKTSNNTTNTNNTTNATQASSTTPTFNNANVAAGYNNLYTDVGNLTYNMPQTAASMVSPVTAAQQTAYNNAPDLSSTYTPYYGQAAGLLSSGSSGATPTVTPTMANAAQIDTNDIQRLMNPYLNDVVSTTLAGLDQKNGADAAALEAQGASSNAFGGSRFGLAQSNLMAQQAQGRAQTEAGLRSDAYTQAAQGAQYDAGNVQQATLANAAAANTASINNANLQDAAYNRQIQAGGLFGTLGNDAGASARSDLTSQLATGQDQRATYQDIATAYPQYLSMIQQLYGLNGSSTMGQNSTGTVNQNSTGTSNSKGKSTDMSMTGDFTIPLPTG